MGSPKPLLHYQGESFLDRLVGLFSRRCSPVLVVLGAHGGRIRAGIRRAREALFVENPNFQLGQLSSMQCGLRAVPPHAGAVLFGLVDHPAVTAATIDALLDDPRPAPLRIPRYRGKRGHPIVLDRALFAEFLDLPPGGTAKDVITRHAHEIAYVDGDDPGILADVDDAAAYARLLAGLHA